MPDIRYEHPLKLPAGWTPTPPSGRILNTSFPRTLTLTEALKFLDEEIRRFPFAAATVYTNFQHVTSDRLRKKAGNDVAGVSVALKAYGREHMIASDHWQLLEQNVYAIHLALRAIRNFEEWGIATCAYALSLFSGNISMKDSAHGDGDPKEDSLPEWMLFLGLGPTATLDDANAIYRRRAKEIGPQEEALLKLNQAIEEARRHLR